MYKKNNDVVIIIYNLFFLFVFFITRLSSLINEDVFFIWVDFKLISIFYLYVNHPQSHDRRGRNNPSGDLLRLRQPDRRQRRCRTRNGTVTTVAKQGQAPMQELRRHAKLRLISYTWRNWDWAGGVVCLGGFLYGGWIEGKEHPSPQHLQIPVGFTGPRFGGRSSALVQC